MHIYEYLFTGVVIVALLLGSTVMVTTLSSPASNAADKDLLKITAEKIMTQMLLDSGYPYDWGNDNTNPENLKVFGLAKLGSTSRQAYELDPNKVQRINSALEGSVTNFVSAYTTAKLLSLNNTYDALDYGFTLEFIETLQVNMSPLGNDVYSVSVFSNYALPIISANVSATLYYANEWLYISSVGPVYSQTSYDGSCTLNLYDENATDSSTQVLAVAVDYYGAQVTKLFNAKNSVSASLFDNYILPYPSSFNVLDGAQCHEIVLIQNSKGIETRNFQIAYTVTEYLTLNSAPEPSAVGVLAFSTDYKLIFAQRDFSNISYRTIPAIQSAASAYSLERTVLIGGVTYVARLYFWRMSS